MRNVSYSNGRTKITMDLMGKKLYEIAKAIVSCFGYYSMDYPTIAPEYKDDIAFWFENDSIVFNTNLHVDDCEYMLYCLSVDRNTPSFSACSA